MLNVSVTISLNKLMGVIAKFLKFVKIVMTIV